MKLYKIFFTCFSLLSPLKALTQDVTKNENALPRMVSQIEEGIATIERKFQSLKEEMLGQVKSLKTKLYAIDDDIARIERLPNGSQKETLTQELEDTLQHWSRVVKQHIDVTLWLNETLDSEFKSLSQDLRDLMDPTDLESLKDHPIFSTSLLEQIDDFVQETLDLMKGLIDHKETDEKE